jgi:serine/threonine-protein phosphatase 6 regulatory ankyrin repeat subunit B
MADRPAQHLLVQAVHLEDLALVEMLLNKGARPNVQSSPGDSPLALATMQGGATMVSMLLSHGADPKLKHSGGKTPLMLAAKRGFLELVLMLLQHPEGRRTVEHRDRVGRTALWLACRRGHTDVALELLLQGGARHQVWDTNEETPLRAAIKSGVRDCIYLLEVSTGIMDHQWPTACHATRDIVKDPSYLY